MPNNVVYQDTFQRTSTGGWDNPEIARWLTPVYDTTTMPGNSPSVTPDVGQFIVPIGGAGRSAQILDLGTNDGETLTLSALTSIPVGASSFVQCGRTFFRVQDANNCLSGSWYVNSTGVVKCRFSKVVAGVSSTISGVDPTVSATYTPGDQYYCDILWAGNTYQMFVWKFGTAKPSSPTIAPFTDNTFLTGTLFGFGSTGNGATTAPVTSQYASVQALNATVTVAPTIYELQPGSTLLGLAPMGITKFFNKAYGPPTGAHGQPHNVALLQREQQIGKVLDIVGAYVSWGEWTGDAGSTYPASIKSNISSIVNGGRNLQLSYFDLSTAPTDWKTGTTAGAYDAVFTSFVDYLVSLNPKPGQIIMRLNWEMNLSTWGTDPAGFIAFWQYVVTLQRTHDPTGLLKFDWCPSYSGTAIWTDFWPGASYVDIIGMDSYNGLGFGDIATLWTRQSGSQARNNNFYQTFLKYGKPYVHGETGTRQQSSPYLPKAQPMSAETWYNSTLGISRALPNIKGIVFWDNSIVGSDDWHLDTVPGPDHYPLSDPITYDASSANPSWMAARNLFYSNEFATRTFAPPAPSWPTTDTDGTTSLGVDAGVQSLTSVGL